MTGTNGKHSAVKYPLSLRVLHWLRALLVLGMIWSGWYMTELPDTFTAKYALFYPNHKQFGVLVWMLALVHLAIRWRNRAVLPQLPEGLARWEKLLSHVVHRLIIALILLIPVLGYSMSSSFTQSDGVPFFFLGPVPELLPKNDAVFEVFQALHKYSAYTLLCLVILHIAGTAKHRLQDKGGENDVLPRML